jgi:hypothetical protein
VTVPLGILLVKLIPDPVMTELRVRALDQKKATSRGGLVAVILIWLFSIALVAALVWPSFSGGF